MPGESVWRGISPLVTALANQRRSFDADVYGRREYGGCRRRYRRLGERRRYGEVRPCKGSLRIYLVALLDDNMSDEYPVYLATKDNNERYDRVIA